MHVVREQARALAVMPNYLQQIAATSAKAKQMTAERVAMKDFLNLQRQAGEAFPHISLASRQPNPNAAQKSNHRPRSRPASAPITRDKVASSGAPSIITRTFAPNVIVIVPRPSSPDVRSAVEPLTATGTNAGPSPAAAN